MAAVEQLTDRGNWRGGVRVELKKDTAREAARKLKKDTANQAASKPDAKPVGGTKRGEASAAAGEQGAKLAGGEKGGLVPAAGLPQGGRPRGTVQLLNGPYGFVMPAAVAGGAREPTRDDNLYFSTKKLKAPVIA